MLKHLEMRFLSKRASIKLLIIERPHTRNILSTKYFLSPEAANAGAPNKRYS